MLKDIIFWKYERASWQWDLLCVLIMCFIFLTPSSWFEKREATQPQGSAVKVQDVSPEEKKSKNETSEVLMREKTQGQNFSSN